MLCYTGMDIVHKGIEKRAPDKQLEASSDISNGVVENAGNRERERGGDGRDGSKSQKSKEGSKANKSGKREEPFENLCNTLEYH